MFGPHDIIDAIEKTKRHWGHDVPYVVVVPPSLMKDVHRQHWADAFDEAGLNVTIHASQAGSPDNVSVIPAAAFRPEEWSGRRSWPE